MRAAIALIAASTLMRFFYAAWLPLLPDESYYFQWSKHLDASYISKGPAVAYTIWAGTHLFGGTNLGVRFFAVLLSAGTAWQIFLLARRFYDQATGLIAVLVTSVVPIYALGSVVMTIDPLSAFFWIWAANCFARAVAEDRLSDWLLAGFAVGCGFLAKYLNALELLAFLAFLALVPAHRHLLRQRGFWLMLAVAVFCTTPVLWWNWHHHWISATALGNRGHLGKYDGPLDLHANTFFSFIGMQMLVISPLLFFALLATIAIVILRWRAGHARNEGELLLFLLFLPVFGMYAVLSWHLRCEPNWPAISYLTLIIILASHWRKLLAVRARAQPFVIVVFLGAWLQTLLMHLTFLMPLPQGFDPMGRVAGWSEIAGHLDDLRKTEHADVLIADAYKEASIFSFHLPDQPFIYTLRHVPPSTQYDLWEKYPTAPSHRALWITDEPWTNPVQADFNTITFVERILVSYRGKPFRIYDVYRCENRPQ